MAAPPSTPDNQYTQQGNAQVYISWDLVDLATSYLIARSTDGVNFIHLAEVVVNNFLDTTVLMSTQYYYKVAAKNVVGTSSYTAVQTIIPCPPGIVCLANIRLQAQQRSDQLNANFLSLPEWNQNITNSYKELYDILIQKYGDDYYYTVPCSYLTSGKIDPVQQAQVFPLPDGISVLDSYGSFTFLGNTSSSTTIDGIASTNGITIGQGINGPGSPAGNTVVAFDDTSVTTSLPITGSNTGVLFTVGTIVPAFYKLMLVEVALNPGDPNSYVTLKKYQRIQQNLWNYPNVYTFYGITNLRYRTTGSFLQVVPISAAGQTIRIHYSPRPRDLIQDIDTMEGISGWEEYIIVDAAIKAMAKEESDPSELVREKLALLARIEAAAENRDVGEPECVSDSRTRNFAWEDGGGFGNGGMT